MQLQFGTHFAFNTRALNPQQNARLSGLVEQNADALKRNNGNHCDFWYVETNDTAEQSKANRELEAFCQDIGSSRQSDKFISPLSKPPIEVVSYLYAFQRTDVNPENSGFKLACERYVKAFKPE